ncbi:unnamed protein product [Timema podura]|uniref:WASH complex subunit 7 central domain-containing protein n=1 Tax=Timema podura TaxID=61482 RepID=A0ABN7PB66_TIMPD|nr:unnamed protein product [Timema podura]
MLRSAALHNNATQCSAGKEKKKKIAVPLPGGRPGIDISNEVRHGHLAVYKLHCIKFLLYMVLKPLCQEVETNLRLHVHSHLQLDDRNPFRGAIYDCSPFLTLKPLRFFNNYINIKGIL